MEIIYKIIYHHLSVKDIQNLGTSDKEIIKKFIENKLTTNPLVFGKPLRKSLKGYRKLRVKNFRIVFKIEKQTVKILAIKHRRDIYSEIIKRLT